MDYYLIMGGSKMNQEIKLYFKSNKGFFATAIYSNGKITVLKGSIISKEYSPKLKFAKMVSELRNINSPDSAVNEEGIVTRDVTFSSPSTAAQFVSGNSTNGLLYWKDEFGVSLKNLLDKNY